MEEARGRGGEKRKGERERKKSAENLNRPAEGRYVPLHLSSRPVPVPCVYAFVVYIRGYVHVLVLVRARSYVRSHMSTALVRHADQIRASRGMFFSSGPKCFIT